MCSKGYPEIYKKNVLIDNLENLSLNENNFLYHAGTKNNGGKIYTGGRVLNFISLSDNFIQARNEVHQCLEKLIGKMVFIEKILVTK